MLNSKSPRVFQAFSLFALALFLPHAQGAMAFTQATKNDGKNLWAFEMGCAFITSNRIQEVLFEPNRLHIDGGDNGGEIYTFTASRRLGELEWEIGNSVFHPQIELPLTLEVVNEHSRAPFLDYNAAYMVRWVDFPGEDYVKTSFAMGVGLSYSSKIYLEDIATHKGMRRAKTQIYWPIQWTFALPQSPQDQLTLFISHQSGGHIFDVGGNNSVGIGYRRGF